MPNAIRIVAAAACLGMAVLASGAAVSSVLADARPELAVRLSPINGEALGNLARRQLVASAQAQAGSAVRKQQMADPFATRVTRPIGAASLAAYKKEPTATGAIFLLALQQHQRGRSEEAKRLLQKARQLSLRNEAVNLFLAQQAAQANDVPATLSLFDEVLRTSRQSRAAILQQFVLATADPAFAQQTYQLLRSNPPWSTDFWQAVPDEPASVRSLARLRLRLSGRDLPFDQQADKRIIYALLGGKEFSLANELYARIVPEARSSGGNLVRNGDFKLLSQLPPIDWDTYATGDFSSEIEPKAGILFASAVSAPGGAVARQWLSLPPGRYRLSARANTFDMLDGDTLLLRLQCIHGGGERRDIMLKQGTVTASIGVPPNGCGEYWLDVVLSPGEANPGFEAEIEQIVVQRVGSGR